MPIIGIDHPKMRLNALKKKRRLDGNKSFDVLDNGNPKKLKLHVSPTAIPDSFFTLRKDAFKKSAYRRTPTIKIFVLPIILYLRIAPEIASRTALALTRLKAISFIPEDHLPLSRTKYA